MEQLEGYFEIAKERKERDGWTYEVGERREEEKAMARWKDSRKFHRSSRGGHQDGEEEKRKVMATPSDKEIGRCRISFWEYKDKETKEEGRWFCWL